MILFLLTVTLVCVQATYHSGSSGHGHSSTYGQSSSSTYGQTQGLSIALPPGSNYRPSTVDPRLSNSCAIPPALKDRVVGIWSPRTQTNLHRVSHHVTQSLCPRTHPFAFLNGYWCCKFDDEAFNRDHGSRCDGGPLSHHSKCCKFNQYTYCPGGICEDNPIAWYARRYRAGQTKNLPGRDLYPYHYNNVHDVDRLLEGDTLLVKCSDAISHRPHIKAFTCRKVRYGPPTMSGFTCDAQSEKFSQRHVTLLNVNPQSHTTARNTCKNLLGGGHLATIEGPIADKIAVKTMLLRGLAGPRDKKCAFIGMSDEKAEGVWKWDSGRPVHYTNWADSVHAWDDQPNNGLQSGAEHYAAMCPWPDYNTYNGYAWFDVGPPRTDNGLIPGNVAASFCTLDKLETFPRAEPDTCTIGPVCHGRFLTTSSTIQSGYTVEIRCNIGFRLVGNNRVRCVDGQFTTLPRCVRDGNPSGPYGPNNPRTINFGSVGGTGQQDGADINIYGGSFNVFDGSGSSSTSSTTGEGSSSSSSSSSSTSTGDEGGASGATGGQEPSNNHGSGGQGPSSCRGGQVWNNCGSPCTKTCSEPGPICIQVCDARCECPQSRPLLENGICVTPFQCRSQPNNNNPYGPGPYGPDSSDDSYGQGNEPYGSGDGATDIYGGATDVYNDGAAGGDEDYTIYQDPDRIDDGCDVHYNNEYGPNNPRSTDFNTDASDL